jgi:hypothetical protein
MEIAALENLHQMNSRMRIRVAISQGILKTTVVSLVEALRKSAITFPSKRQNP